MTYFIKARWLSLPKMSRKYSNTALKEGRSNEGNDQANRIEAISCLNDHMYHNFDILVDCEVLRCIIDFETF